MAFKPIISKLLDQVGIGDIDNLPDLITYLNTVYWNKSGNTLSARGTFGSVSGAYGFDGKVNNVTKWGVENDGSFFIGTTAKFTDTDFSVKGSGSTNATYNTQFKNSSDTVLGWMRNDGVFNSLIGYNIDSVKAFRYNNFLGNILFGNSAYDVDTDGADNLIIGAGSGGSVTTASKNVVVGNQSLASLTTGGGGAGENTAIGAYIASGLTTGYWDVFLGPFSGQGAISANQTMFLSPYTRTRKSDISSSIIMAFEAVGVADNEFVAGSNSAPIFDVYFGCGHGLGASTLPSTYTPVNIHAQGDCAANSNESTVGADLVLLNNRGRGTGLSADIVFKYSPPVASGTTLQDWADAMKIIGSTGAIEIPLTDYADNAAAISGGLTTNQLYRTGGDVRIVT